MIIVLFTAHLAQLQAENQITQSYRFAKGTAQNMLSGIRTWITYCVYFSRPVLPATACSVVPFLELMSVTVTYSHLKHLLSAVKFYHLTKGLVFPEHDFEIVNTLHGLKRRKAHTPHQALPLTPAILRNMFTKLDMQKVKDRALWCSYLVTFYCLFRKSNSVPKSANNLDLKRTLLRKHIQVDAVNNMVYIHVTFAKTIQFGNRDLVIPIPGNSDSALDPVRHLLALFSAAPCLPDSPAFSFKAGHFITYSTFTTSLKKLLSAAGYNPSLYSGHSFRRGGATFLFQLGASVLQIQASGDWSSQCFVRYLHVSEEERFRVQLLVAGAISAGA